MANGWSASDYVIPGTVTGVVSNQPISKEFPITARGALNCVFKITVAGVTNVGTQTLKLQTAIGSDWVDSKSTTFTADGAYYIKLQTTLAGDQTYLPLLNKGRIVLTQTNAGDIATVSKVEVVQEL